MIQRVTDAVSFFSVQKFDPNEFSDDQVLRLMGSGCNTAVATGLPIRRLWVRIQSGVVFLLFFFSTR